MRHKLFHCWDCGQKVIAQNETGKYKPMACLQQMRFKLSNGAFMVNPFCDHCAAEEWTQERLSRFREAIIEILPSFSEVTIKSCEGPVNLITGVVQ